MAWLNKLWSHCCERAPLSLELHLNSGSLCLTLPIACLTAAPGMATAGWVPHWPSPPDLPGWTSALSWPCAHAEQPHSSGFTWSPSPGLLNPVRPWLVRTGQPERPAPVVAAGQGCGLAAAQGDPQGSFRPNQCLGICILYSVWCIWLFQVECFPLYFTWLSARWISWYFFSFLDHCKKTNKQCNYTDFQRVILKESCYYLQPRHPVVSSVK